MTASKGAAMYGSGENMLLPFSLVDAIWAGNVLVKVVGGWFGGGWAFRAFRTGGERRCWSRMRR